MRPPPSATRRGSAIVPSAAKIDRVVSTISSIFSTPVGRRRSRSRRSQVDASAATSSGAVIFGSVMTKPGGSVPPATFEHGGDEQIQGPKAAGLQRRSERLDADPDPGRQRARRRAARGLLGRRTRESIFFAIRPVAEPVLEIDAEVLDRLARELLRHRRGRAPRSFDPSYTQNASGSGLVFPHSQRRRPTNFRVRLGRCAPRKLCEWVLPAPMGECRGGSKL